MALILWILSIVLGVFGSFGIGFLILWITNKILKIKSAEDSKIPLWATCAMGIFCFVAIMGSTFNSCNSSYHTYSDEIGNFLSPILIIAPIIIIAAIIAIFIESIFKGPNYKTQRERFEELVEKGNQENRKREERKAQLEAILQENGGETNSFTCNDNEESVKVSICKGVILISSDYYKTQYKIKRKVLFEDILDFTTINDSSTMPITSTTQTSTQNGNMLARGLIGGLALGGLGAGIGALTANKRSVTEYSGGGTLHEYSINLMINSLENPSIFLNFVYNKEEYAKALAIFTFIKKNTMS